MELKFRWNGDEGRMSKADRGRLLEAPGITELDFLVDVIAEAQALYDELYRAVYVHPQTKKGPA